jgi:hypothetical protein
LKEVISFGKVGSEVYFRLSEFYRHAQEKPTLFERYNLLLTNLLRIDNTVKNHQIVNKFGSVD